MEFKNTETLKNITRAFAGECMDGAKYQYLADTATQQKLSQVASVLKALATNEMAHAKIFYDLVNNMSNNNIDIVEIKATVPMLSGDFNQMFEITTQAEQRQFETVYPAFAKIAEKEGYTDVAKIFMQIAKIECVHAKVLSEIGQMIKNNSIYQSDEETMWKCMNCGHEDELKKAWKKCPLCTKDQGYIKINLSGSPKDCKN